MEGGSLCSDGLMLRSTARPSGGLSGMAGAMGALRGRRPSSGVLEALHVRIWIILLGDLLDDLARFPLGGAVAPGAWPTLGFVGSRSMS